MTAVSVVTPREDTYGELLRAERKRAGKTLFDVASWLERTIVNISDVELGHAPPLLAGETKTVCAMFKIDPSRLLELRRKP